MDSDEEAIATIRRFLRYLPSHHGELPPLSAVPDGSEDTATRVLDILPESRTQVYDMREVIQHVFDRDSLFELKPRFGKSVVTGLARLGGETVGVLANNPMFKGGAIDVDACRMFTGVEDCRRAVDSLSHFDVLPALHFGIVTLPTNSQQRANYGSAASPSSIELLDQHGLE